MKTLTQRLEPYTTKKQRLEKIEKLIEVLQLETVNGFYHTAWGKKTKAGLIATIMVILELEEEGEKQ